MYSLHWSWFLFVSWYPFHDIPSSLNILRISTDRPGKNSPPVKRRARLWFYYAVQRHRNWPPIEKYFLDCARNYGTGTCHLVFLLCVVVANPSNQDLCKSYGLDRYCCHRLTLRRSRRIKFANIISSRTNASYTCTYPMDLTVERRTVHNRASDTSLHRLTIMTANIF